MDKIIEINSAVNGFVWGPIMLALLVGTGIYLSFRVGFIQFSKIGYWWKNTIGKIFQKSEAGEGEITPMQAVSTALASTVGTGNIAGVTGAIILGGPGAVFWMWISALFGMVTKFAEVTLAVKYRERNEKGDWCGGPMYYIKNGLGPKWKWLGVIFSVFGALAAFGIGNISQINSIASSVNSVAVAFHENAKEFDTIIGLITGVVIAIFVALVLLGGVKRIGQVTEKLVPGMAAIYIVCALVVVIANAGTIPMEAWYLIRDIDAISEQLKILQDNNVTVLWRPLHEASGGWFWWGCRGKDAYQWLWNLMYERQTHYHKLNNLIWVWNGQDPDWYVGDDRCDIIGEDVYAAIALTSCVTGRTSLGGTCVASVEAQIASVRDFLAGQTEAAKQAKNG